MEAIKNIIFDLGGVIIQLHVDRTVAAFRALIGNEELYQSVNQELNRKEIFQKLETNGITEEAFIEALTIPNPNVVTKEQLTVAWNAMLGHIPVTGLNLVKELKELGYNVYVLSNTNSIHLRAFRNILKQEHGVTDFDTWFDKTYYSHLVELRKPDVAIFEHVLQDAQIEPRETLFIDDMPANLAGARMAGMHTLLHPANSNIEQTVKRYLQL